VAPGGGYHVYYCQYGVPDGSRTVAPGVSEGKPGTVSLLPVDWSVTWTLKNRSSRGDGLVELVKAQKVTDANSGDALKIKSRTTIVKGKDLNPTEVTVTNDVTTTNVITLPIGTTYTSAITRIGKMGSVSFKLEYIPFNLAEENSWSGFIRESAFAALGSTPVWVIRNGVNDKAQNGNTNFANLGKSGHTDPVDTENFANGNGAVSFAVAADKPGTGELVIRDEVFIGPSTSNMPVIGFTTEGYTGEAEAYYAVVPVDETPAYSAYTAIAGSPLAAGKYQKQITLDTANGNYDVYVLLYKDGKVSVAKASPKNKDYTQFWNYAIIDT
jgi:hypothetical protein